MKLRSIGIYKPVHKATLLALDLAFLALAFSVVAMIRLGSAPSIFTLEYLGINTILIFSLFLGGAYSSNANASLPKLPLRTFFIVLAGAAPSLLFIYALGPEKFTAMLGRGVFPFSVVAFGILAVANRSIVNRIFSAASTDREIVFLGALASHERLMKTVQTSDFNISVCHIESLGLLKKRKNLATAIVICPEYKPDRHAQKLLLDYRLSGIPIFSLTDFCERFLFLIPIHEIDDNWFIRTEGFTMLHSSIANRTKRALDITVAIILIVATLPITAVTAALLLLTSPGNIFFSQVRIGIQGKEFTLYKFRTMKPNAEKAGAQWASIDDPRILPIGHFLRASRIDELPQCLNILKGEMSIIGPRPERPEFTKELANSIPYYELRHIVKPGLTGWAQVSYPYGASIDDGLKKLQYDLYYIKNHSLLLDLNILLRTVLVTLRRGGR